MYLYICLQFLSAFFVVFTVQISYLLSSFLSTVPCFDATINELLRHLLLGLLSRERSWALRSGLAACGLVSSQTVVLNVQALPHTWSYNLHTDNFTPASSVWMSLFLFLAWLFWLGLPVLCWREGQKRAPHRAPDLREKAPRAHHWDDAHGGFFMYGFYSILISYMASIRSWLLSWKAIEFCQTFFLHQLRWSYSSPFIPLMGQITFIGFHVEPPLHSRHKSHLVALYDPSNMWMNGLWVFCWAFCIRVHQGHCPVVVSSCSVCLLCYQGHAGHMKGVGKCCHFFNCLEKFKKDKYWFFFKVQ